ncbi:MAG: hypothetical protein K2X29_11005 [Candidatus Obscuribacterales bacterium]|nr:hypothetical protein [Candidatus Obscuribacterales bacterium]
MQNQPWLKKLAAVVRLICLALLFGGSASIVFTAIVLVKTAVAAGVPQAEAAAANAPIFINFAKVALGAAIALLAAESLDFATQTNKSKSTLIRYAASFASIATAMVFALGLTPLMAELLPAIATNPTAHEDFHKLHELSRLVFGGTILFALISLVTPAISGESRS